MLTPRTIPCSSCPYRRTCPSGVWDKSEYEKLPAYDLDTSNQPPGVFMCHDDANQQTLCRGWLDTHDKPEMLALRLAASMGLVDPAIVDLPPSGVPVFSSGKQAARHGIKDIHRPKEAAKRVVRKLKKRKQAQ